MLFTETGWDQVEEGGLGVFVDVHHEDGEEEAGQVGCRTTTLLFLLTKTINNYSKLTDECGVEVEMRVPLKTDVITE